MPPFENLIYPKINIGLKSDNCQTIIIKTSEGMHMVEKVRLNGPRKRQLRDVNPGMEDWLKYHTIQDLRDMVFELYNRGEDISEMVGLIHEMDAMAHRTYINNEENVYTFSEYDILSYVEEAEQAFI
jgi:hypothetical protein